jgi:hypothetical protein
MLVFSPSLLLYQVITTLRQKPPFTNRPMHFLLPPILQLPESLGSFSGCISIYMWFYNQFFHISSHTSKIIFSSNYTRRCLPHWRLFILLYIFINILITLQVHQGHAKLSLLGYLPTIMFFGRLSFWLPSNTLSNLLYNQLHNVNSSQLPTLLDSNSDKLSYLSAWHSLHQKQSPRL